MFKINSYLLLIFISCLAFLACDEESQLQKDIAKIETNVVIERFDKLFADANTETIKGLRKKYPFILNENISDSLWLETSKDSLQQALAHETAKAFKDEVQLQVEIEKLFQHIKYYFKAFREPRIIAATSNVEYRNKVIVTDTISLIALDTYLGAKHEYYQNIPNYLRAKMQPSQIVTDLAEAYAEKFIYQTQRKTLLDEMIYHGKVLYFKDLVIPFKTEAERIGYTNEQLDWSKANEAYIWRYFIEREMLFSTDSKLPSRFINPAPFSKFYLEEIDNQSPGELGRYIGWQIVKAYVKNNKVSLQDLLQTDAETIFNKSKFKPKK